MGIQNYYRNAGLPALKASSSPVDFAVNVGKGVVSGVKNVASSVLAAPVTIPAKVRGMVADNARGNTLYKEGYGGYYDSASSIAAKGKSAGPQRAPRK